MRNALIAAALAAPLAFAAALPAQAASPAQREAAQQVERDQRQDRVAETAREVERGGAPSSPALVDDMNRQRPAPGVQGSVLQGNSTSSPGGTGLPLIGDNPQR